MKYRPWRNPNHRSSTVSDGRIEGGRAATQIGKIVKKGLRGISAFFKLSDQNKFNFKCLGAFLISAASFTSVGMLVGGPAGAAVGLVLGVFLGISVVRAARKVRTLSSRQDKNYDDPTLSTHDSGDYDYGFGHIGGNPGAPRGVHSLVGESPTRKASTRCILYRVLSLWR